MAGLREHQDEFAGRFRALLQTTSRLIELIPSKDLLRSLLEASRDFVQADAYCVWRSDDQGNWSVVCSEGLSQTFITETLNSGPSQQLPDGPVVVQPEDLAQQVTPLLAERWNRYAQEGIRSLLILPLKIHGAPIASLVLYRRAARRFSVLEIESAQTLANIASAALTNSELYQQQQCLRAEAEERASRGAFLAKASSILAESLDYESTLKNIARAAVPTFADWCAVDLLNKAQQLKRLAVAHVDPRKVERARELFERYPPQEGSERGILHVTRTGEAEMMELIPQELIERSARDEIHRQILNELQLRSYICVPLKSGGRIFGALTFVNAESGRLFEQRDLALANEISQRAAQAIENAQLYRDLRASEDRYRAIVECQSELICRTRPTGEIVFANDAMNKIVSGRGKPLEGSNLLELIAAEEREGFSRKLRDLSSDSEAIRLEARISGAREARWILWTVTGLGNSGKLTEVQVSGIDIHDRKLAEDSLREADRRKDEFLAALAHELRNPLAPIRTGLELMKLAPEDAELIAETRETMERQTLQLVALVDDLLDVSRITRGKLQLRPCVVLLSDVVRTAVEASQPLIEAGRHVLSISIPDLPISLHVDPHRLAQIISNLLNNSANYTPEGGKISLQALEIDGQLELLIRDTGRGIPAEMLEDIFEMFTQVDCRIESGYSGLGIGLTLVKSLVELHGGQIEAASEGLNRGSEFRIRLPVLAQPSPGSVSRESSTSGDASAVRHRIMIVDDNRPAADMLARVVKLLGHEVQTVYGGAEAVSLANAFLPDLIFLDLGMPEMNGYQAAQIIRRDSAGRRFLLVALTGWGQAHDRERTQEAGFDLHLVKPLEVEELKSVIAKVDTSP